MIDNGSSQPIQSETNKDNREEEKPEEEDEDLDDFFSSLE